MKEESNDRQREYALYLDESKGLIDAARTAPSASDTTIAAAASPIT